MQTRQNYGGLDRFRVAAALLVIAIHTSPLSSISDGADFFLTRVLARVAVPFFLMVTGQFVVADFLDPSTRDLKKLKNYFKKTALLYAFCILLYLPIGIYAGHYRNISPGAVLRMLVFDGTFYHLWYFPACILGVALVCLMSLFLNRKAITLVSVTLYIIGLFGDSYYGLIQNVPLLKSIYDFGFSIFSYTRNGLFLAPLFLMLGAWIGTLVNLQAALNKAADSPEETSQENKNTFWLFLGGAVFSFVNMTVEAFILRHFQLQRHDSMYLALLPTMVLLYLCLLYFPQKPEQRFRTGAMWIYILHPAVIVVIRGVARLLHLTGLLVENSVVHYISVALLSVAAGYLASYAQDCLTPRLLSLINRLGSGGQETKAETVKAENVEETKDAKDAVGVSNASITEKNSHPETEAVTDKDSQKPKTVAEGIYKPSIKKAEESPNMTKMNSKKARKLKRAQARKAEQNMLAAETKDTAVENTVPENDHPAIAAKDLNEQNAGNPEPPAVQEAVPEKEAAAQNTEDNDSSSVEKTDTEGELSTQEAKADSPGLQGKEEESDSSLQNIEADAGPDIPKAGDTENPDAEQMETEQWEDDFQPYEKKTADTNTQLQALLAGHSIQGAMPQRSAGTAKPMLRRNRSIQDVGAKELFRRNNLRAWIELDSAALAHNVEFLRSRLPEHSRLMPAVKADAYGHGAVMIARQLNRLNVNAFCVACLSEGVALRKAGIKGKILILGYTSPDDFPLLKRYQLTQTVVDYPYAQTLNRFGQPLHVHIGIDTGMHRLGIRCENLEEIIEACQMKNLIVDGFFTHLSVSDSLRPEDRAFTDSQIQAFYQVIDILKSHGFPCPGLHLLASYGILNLLQDRDRQDKRLRRTANVHGISNHAELAADYVRPGIALYGLLSTEADSNVWRDSLQPVLSLKARVVSVRPLYAGEAAGYGIAFTAKEDMRIAAVSIGYADGLPRELSYGIGSMLINGNTAPIIGRICMDQTLVDVSHIPNIKAGNTAVIIGKSGEMEITADRLAEQCGTITNEILSRLGARLERIMV